MAKTFKEVFDEIKNNISVSKKGKPIKTFSRSDFDKLAKAFLNEIGYEVDAISTKNGEVVTTKVYPVKEFRSMLATILKDFGVDAAEREKILNGYEIKNVDGLYEVCSELIYKYIEAGKKFDFVPKMDFQGSLTLKEVPKMTGTYRDILTKEEIDITKEAHKILERKSKCPVHLKKKNKKK